MATAIVEIQVFLYCSVFLEGCLIPQSSPECTLLSCHPASFWGPSDFPMSSKERAPAEHARGSRPLLQSWPCGLLQSLTSPSGLLSARLLAHGRPLICSHGHMPRLLVGLSQGCQPCSWVTCKLRGKELSWCIHGKPWVRRSCREKGLEFGRGGGTLPASP